MKLTTLTVGLLGMVLAGCANMPGRGCRDEVTVNHAAANLRARPPVLNVCRGDTITLRIVPRGTRVSTAPKAGNPGWLTGATEEGDITLTVPENETVGAERDYLITVEGVGVLDPRFRIIE